jgi:CheY-like chemotaxis protein
MGGSLSVQSTPGRGSTFSFSVPFETAPASDRSSGPPLEPPLPKGSAVLVSAGNQTNLSFLEETLQGWQAEVKLLSSAEEVLATARRACAEGRPFQLVILDRALGKADGFALAEQIRVESQLADAVIVMTTVIDLGASARCQVLPGVEHIVKPVSARDLSAAIKRALRRHAKLGSTEPPPTDTPARTLSGQPLKVLLVEDNAVNQKLAMRLLERAGHSVAVAWDGIHAMEALATQNFDCVLMDVQMPRMDGLETTRAIRKLEAATGAHVSIVAMTAHALDSDRDRCLEAGMDDYMSKPISRDKLLKILEAVSSRHTCVHGNV